MLADSFDVGKMFSEKNAVMNPVIHWNIILRISSFKIVLFKEIYVFKIIVLGSLNLSM